MPLKILFALLFLSACAQADKSPPVPDSPRAQDGTSLREYRLDYHVLFDLASRRARVIIKPADNHGLERLSFNTANLKPDIIRHTGRLTTAGDRLNWTPPKKNAQLEYEVTVDRIRRDGKYDAYFAEDWLLMRGDNLVPPARVQHTKGAESRAFIHFDLPEAWRSVNTPWESAGQRSFSIPKRQHRFVRPTGWLVAGKLATRREKVGDTHIIVSAPRGHGYRPMELLSFITFVWPQFGIAFDQVPDNLLITGADEPFWRGGLSGPNSLFLHRGRPLVSENGTSTVLHELFHVVTGLRGKPQHDWITEGMAEYYAVELLYRAGGITAKRRQTVLDGLAEWGKDTGSLLTSNAKGPVTARAVQLIAELDQEIRTKSREKHNLDDLIRWLDLPGRVGRSDLEEAFEDLLGARSDVLGQAIIHPQAASQ